jgi:hypothetical protein
MLNSMSTLRRAPRDGELWTLPSLRPRLYMRVGGVERDTPPGCFASVLMTGVEVGVVHYFTFDSGLCFIVKPVPRALHISNAVEHIAAIPVGGQLWSHCTLDAPDIYMCVIGNMPNTMAYYQQVNSSLLGDPREPILLSVRLFGDSAIGRVVYTRLPGNAWLRYRREPAKTYILKEQAPLEI